MKTFWTNDASAEARIFREEENRQEIERYELKRMGRWFIIPIGGTICYLAYAIYDLLARGEFHLSLSLIAVSIVLSALSVLKIQSDWEMRLFVKRRIYNGDINYPFNPYHYDEEMIYTDSQLKFYWYRISATFAMVASLSMMIVFVLVMCEWFRSALHS